MTEAVNIENIAEGLSQDNAQSRIRINETETDRRKKESVKAPIEDSSSELPNPILDGRWSCVVCFAIFWLNFTVAGIATSNGILLLGLVGLYNTSVPKAAMVGSIFLGALMCSGPLVLVLFTFQVSHRQVIISSGCMAFLSTIASVFAPQIEFLYFTHGIIAGGSMGMAYFAGNTILVSYFKKKRSIAVGIVCFGGGCGVFCFNYLLEKSISFYGMRGTFLLLSGIYLNIIVYGSLCRPLSYWTSIKNNIKGMKENSTKVLQSETNQGFESEMENIKTENKSSENEVRNSANVTENITYSTERRLSKISERISHGFKSLFSNLFDPVVFKSSGLQLLLFIYFVWAAGESYVIFIPANVVDIGLSSEEGALIMSVYGIFAALSQLGVGMVADLLHVPISYILTFSMTSLIIISIAIPFCHSFIAFAICTAIYGTFHGVTTAIRVLLATSILGVKNLDKSYAPVCLMVGIGYIVFPLLAGTLYKSIQSFAAIFYFNGGVLFTGLIASIGLLYMQVKGKFCE